MFSQKNMGGQMDQLKIFKVRKTKFVLYQDNHSADNWMKRVLENKDWFAEQTQYKSDESKRPGNPKSHADIFGIEGSFRKLDID